MLDVSFKVLKMARQVCNVCECSAGRIVCPHEVCLMVRRLLTMDVPIIGCDETSTATVTEAWAAQSTAQAVTRSGQNIVTEAASYSLYVTIGMAILLLIAIVIASIVFQGRSDLLLATIRNTRDVLVATTNE